MIGLMTALLSGLLMSIQGVFNTEVTKTAGIWVTTTFVQASALVVCIVIWAITDRSSFGTLLKVEPKYMLIGGAIGTFITFTVIKSMEMLGPARAVMWIVISQIMIAYLIEIFGLFGVEKQSFEWQKVLGIFITLAGIVLFKWK